MGPPVDDPCARSRRVVSRVTPTHPDKSVTTSVEVIAVLRVHVSGSVSRVSIVHSGGAKFDEAAKRAFLGWRFGAEADLPKSCGDHTSVHVRVVFRVN